ncbi:MAG: hypothetical protein ABR505_08245 [Actinomycetota bacterium]
MAAEAAPRPVRVFVVSDDHAIINEAKFGFPPEIEVSVANDARDAWTLMQTKTPSAVIVDLQTGSAGGFALAKDMSSDGRLANVPVLILLERDQDEWIAKQAGAARTRNKRDTSAVIRDVLELLKTE